jgi:hypothetical protein
MLRLFFATLVCCQFFLWEGALMSKENTLVFVTPIIDGKADTLRENPFHTDEEALLKDLGIAKYHPGSSPSTIIIFSSISLKAKIYNNHS